MDKNAIKKYAVWARNELIARVSQRAQRYGITKDQIVDANADSVNGIILTDTEKKQRQALIQKIKEKGFEQVMEEVAYTWFNRFSALRFMEVNGYLPSHVRVFTDQNNAFKPEIMSEAIHLDLDGLDMEKVYALKEANNDDELFKYLIITQCNDLSKILPGMFQKIADYTELLFPDNLLREGSVIEQMIALIPEEDWKDQVQIIGWLYQYYIAEPKDELINARKQYKNKDIPYVTQLFTSDWIVRFIVENSLGRLWIEGHENSNLKNNLEYYLEEGNEQSEHRDSIKGIISQLAPEKIRCIDPCAGSGHIIAYGFDVLMEIYKEYGYSERDAATSIVKNNIYGLDIDERAIQLASFAIMMKGCQYDRRFLHRGIQPNVYCIRESNNIDKDLIDYFVNGRKELKINIDNLLSQMKNASIYGAAISINGIDFKLLNARINEIKEDISIYKDLIVKELIPIIKSAELLSERYTIVFTNPPYMATRYMPNMLKEYISERYEKYKSDMFAVFIVRCSQMCETFGNIGLLTPYVWMFIQSYEELRKFVYDHMTFSSLVQLEYNAFEAACVPVSAFTFRNYRSEIPFGCIKLSDFKGSEIQAPKTIYAIKNKSCGYRYLAIQKDFEKIPGFPVAYWVSKNFIASFEKGISIDAISDFTGSQQITADNDRFLRQFWEISNEEIRDGKWLFYAKGGEFRKWFGNITLVIDWTPTAIKFYSTNKTSNLLGEKYRGKEGITYTELTSSINTFRYLPIGCIFDKKGPSIVNVQHLYYCLAVFCTPLAPYYFSVFNPSISTQVRDVKNFPIIIDEKIEPEVTMLAKENVAICKEDWDLFETSWDFKKSPLVRGNLVEKAFRDFDAECRNRFVKLKENEEKLNQLFINLYGLEDTIDYKVRDEYVSVRLADKKRDIRSLISYAVGCILGRYSLDRDGIAFAGGQWNQEAYKSFPVDKDGIIPVCDDEYFDDDVTNLFVTFVKIVYGEDTLEKNLQFIASALNGKGTPREVIRNYFANEFFDDHCRAYQKRPIYWLFDSGKKNGFKCLIYMHRYQPDTIARIRTDYVHEQQSRYRTAILELSQRMDTVSAGERVKLSKKLKHLQEQSAEIHNYEEKIHHLADQYVSIKLDDGVKANYAKFQDVLAKIK